MGDLGSAARIRSMAQPETPPTPRPVVASEASSIVRSTRTTEQAAPAKEGEEDDNDNDGGGSGGGGGEPSLLPTLRKYAQSLLSALPKALPSMPPSPPSLLSLLLLLLPPARRPRSMPWSIASRRFTRRPATSRDVRPIAKQLLLPADDDTDTDGEPVIAAAAVVLWRATPFPPAPTPPVSKRFCPAPKCVKPSWWTRHAANPSASARSAAPWACGTSVAVSLNMGSRCSRMCVAGNHFHAPGKTPSGWVWRTAPEGGGDKLLPPAASAASEAA